MIGSIGNETEIKISNSITNHTFNEIKINENENKILDTKNFNLSTLKNDSEFTYVSINNNLEYENKQYLNEKIKIDDDIVYKNSNLSESFPNNTSLERNFFIVIYKITSPDEEDLNTLSYILKLQSNKESFHKICYQCLDNLSNLNKLYKDIILIKEDMVNFGNNTVFTRQELIIRFSDYINRVNLVKIQLFEMNTNLDLLKSLNCPNHDDNLKHYEDIKKKANYLIEKIQDSIRKKNLNINFIIIT